jgi:hypothetical protein
VTEQCELSSSATTFAGTGSFTTTNEGVIGGNYITSVPADIDPNYKTGQWHAKRR